MRDFYAPSAPVPLDQAHGLRRLFAGARQHLLPVAANPHVAASGVMLDQLTAALVQRGHRVLVVDAADRSPAPPEMSVLDLGSCIDALSPQVSYLAARGLPLAYVDTRGSAGKFVEALLEAAPRCDAILLHANASDLARMFLRRAARPLVIGADHPESIKHAYAACKLLAQRCGLMTFDLLLAARPGSRRAHAIARSMASCADGFIGALLHDWAVIDPEAGPQTPPGAALDRVIAAQMSLHDEVLAPHAAPAAPVRVLRSTN